MKRIITLALLALVSAYGIGLVTLGESGAMRFVTRMESHMSEGDADAVCAMLHDDLEVDIVDHSTEGGQDTNGGKAELCELTRVVVTALGKLPHDMNVRFDEVSVKRDWLHPWTSEVSYVENRSLTIQGANVTLKTVSEDTVTLVQTLTGVKLRKLKAEVFLAE